MISSQKALKGLTARAADGLFEPSPEQAADMRRILMMIYKDIWDVCEKHGLNLILGGGSALGAVRHGGMIPWDDDIDLMLTRAEYEVFKQIFDRELGHKYIMQVPNCPDHVISNLYMKIILRGTERLEIQKIGAPGAHGLWVDMFPIEYAPANGLLRRAKGFFMNVLAYTAVSGYMKAYDNEQLRAFMSQTKQARMNYRLRMALGSIVKPFGYERLYNLYDRVVQGKRDEGYITVPTGIHHYTGEIYKTPEYLPGTDVTFGGMPARVPTDKHKYLSTMYGDYMTPPPPEKRERHFYVTLDLGPYASK